MKPIHVCIPVLKRYDLLRKLVLSLNASTVLPAGVHVVDNGRDAKRVSEALAGLPYCTDIFTPTVPLGVAASWNWFINYVPEERIIANDDVTFAPDSLRRMVETEGLIVSALLGSNACSCFLIRDACVEKVGLFDETISPGYAYFEDCDYYERLRQAGLDFTGVECGVVHLQSQTLEVATEQEKREHNLKFVRAQENFVRKWGHMPHGKVRQFA